MRRIVIEVAAFLIGATFLATTIPLGSTAEAAASSCGAAPSGNFHIGMYLESGSELDGVQSDVEARDPALCPTSADRFSLQSPMIYRSDGTGWAQIGVWNLTSLCCFRFMWQWKRGDSYGLNTGNWGTPDPFLRYNFKVTREASDGHLHMLYSDPDITPPCNQSGFCPETNFDPHSAWTQQLGTIFSETTHAGNDMAGTDSTRADYDDILVRSINGGWRNANSWSGIPNQRPCYWHRDTVTSLVHFRTWTDPINHGTTC
jgi:hypothetical protein